MDKIKQEILKTAADAFLKIGIRSVSVEDICDELRISKKTFYSYFRQKEELVMSVLNSFTSNHHEYEACLKDKEFSNVIDKILWMKQVTLAIQNEKKHERFFHDLLKYYPTVYDAFAKDRRLVTEQLFATQIQEGVSQGLFRTDINRDFISKSLTVSLQYFIDLSIKHPRKYNKKAIVDFMVDSYLRMACNEKGLQYYISLIS
jgi:TetR/AcrR family transcriptional regulator, cholesterol catabolism regulator